MREAGGLAVIGTERHEARRIDNQLRGRSGRQGDPGSAQFYLSLEDDLMRLFGGGRMDKIGRLMQSTGLEDDMPIQAKMVTKGIESAQRQVESMHASSRKYVLEYDDVMDKQRNTIYSERNSILDGKKYGERVGDLIEETVNNNVAMSCSPHTSFEDWDFETLNAWYKELTGQENVDLSKLDHDEDTEKLTSCIIDKLNALYESKKTDVPQEVFSQIENQVMLRVIDQRWMAHLSEMDYLKTGIGLRAIGQRDPLVEYKEEAFNAFGLLVANIYEDFLRTVLHLQVQIQEEPEPQEELDEDDWEDDEILEGVSYSQPDENASSGYKNAQVEAAAAAAGETLKPAMGKTQTFVKDKDDPFANVGRNDPCPCGSGKKYKKCHGANN